MNLHHDKDAFEELLIGAANELMIPTNIIEKDYYVTIVLKSLSEKLKDMVFKGGDITYKMLSAIRQIFRGY